MNKSSASEYIMRTAVKIINVMADIPRDVTVYDRFLSACIKMLDAKLIVGFNLLSEAETISKYAAKESKICSLGDPGLTGKGIYTIAIDYDNPAAMNEGKKLLAEADLIILDHKGNGVESIFKTLTETNYNRFPLLIVNGITEERVKKIWDTLPNPKLDLSSFGRENGTGIYEIKKYAVNPEELDDNHRFRKLHIGCGYKKLEGFINVDVRPTEAADLVHSCVSFDDFPAGYFDIVYSHAFFEHLTATEELICIQSIKRILSARGSILFLGIPDFEIIAGAYLQKAKFNYAGKFDLEQVYRYTHGSPEQGGSDWYYEQLHKSVFDKDRINTLLHQAGYKKYIIFRYAFRDEYIALNLGFLTLPESYSGRVDISYVKSVIENINSDVNLNSLELISVKSSF